jgi:hypothetical protein
MVAVINTLTTTANGYHIQQEQHYSPLTKSLNIEETLMLVQLTAEMNEVEAWRDEAIFRLPQPSHQRRLEIVRMAQHLFLPTQDDAFVDTPLRRLLINSRVDARVKRDLMYFQYLRETPLVWEAIAEIMLPLAEASANGIPGIDGEVTTSQLDRFLADRLSTQTPSTVTKTRNHITGHLLKFGLVRGADVPGDRIAKRFFAHYYEPDPRAFWFALVSELADHGSYTRSVDTLINRSWTRIGFCTRPAYVRYVLEEAERSDLAVPSFFGSEKQLTWRGPDPVAKVTEAILYG